MRLAQPRRGLNAVAEQVFSRILQDQNVRIDTASGASLTTKAASKAVENALNRAK